MTCDDGDGRSLTYVNIGLTEVNHQANAENGDRDSKEEADGLELSGVANDEANQDCPQAGTIVLLAIQSPIEMASRLIPYAIDVANIAGLRNVKPVDHLEETEEIAVPDIKADENRGSEDIGANDGAVREKGVRDKGNGRKELLPNGKHDESDESSNQEADDERRLPSIGLVGVDVEWEEEHSQSSRQNKQPDDIKFSTVVDQRLDKGSLAFSRADYAELLRLLVVVHEEEEQRQGDDRSDDGEATEPPSETRSVQKGTGDRTGEPCGNDVGRTTIGEDEASVNNSMLAFFHICDVRGTLPTDRLRRDVVSARKTDSE